MQSTTSVLNRLNQIRQINQSSGGTAATPETGGAGGATSSLAGGQPTSLSGSGIGTGGGGGGGQAAGTGGGGGERAGTGGGRGTTERRARTTREARTAEGAATRGVQRPMATKERRYQPPTSLVVAGWVEGIADYERRGSSTPTALGVLDTGTRMQSGTVQGGSTSTGPAPTFPGSTRWYSALSQAGAQQSWTSTMVLRPRLKAGASAPTGWA